MRIAKQHIVHKNATNESYDRDVVSHSDVDDCMFVSGVSPNEVVVSDAISHTFCD